jgi:hypothetical protein
MNHVETGLHLNLHKAQIFERGINQCDSAKIKISATVPKSKSVRQCHTYVEVSKTDSKNLAEDSKNELVTQNIRQLRDSKIICLRVFHLLSGKYIARVIRCTSINFSFHVYLSSFL